MVLGLHFLSISGHFNSSGFSSKLISRRSRVCLVGRIACQSCRTSGPPSWTASFQNDACTILIMKGLLPFPMTLIIILFSYYRGTLGGVWSHSIISSLSILVGVHVSTDKLHTAGFREILVSFPRLIYVSMSPLRQGLP